MFEEELRGLIKQQILSHTGTVVKFCYGHNFEPQLNFIVWNCFDVIAEKIQGRLLMIQTQGNISLTWEHQDFCLVWNATQRCFSRDFLVLSWKPYKHLFPLGTSRISLFRLEAFWSGGCFEKLCVQHLTQWTSDHSLHLCIMVMQINIWSTVLEQEGK